jgi:hypothetical protein
MRIAFDPYARAQQQHELELIKAANPGCYTLAGVPYIAVFDPQRGIVLQKAGRRGRVAPGQMSLDLFGGAPAAGGGKKPKEGDTRTNRAGNKEVLRGGRWRRADKPAAAMPKQGLQVVQDEPAKPTPVSTDEGSGGGGDPLASVPDGVQTTVKIAIDQTKRWNAKVERARETDRQFQGGGRYTWEVTNGEQFQESDKIAKFRQMANEKGIDADAALEAMGYEPPLQLQPNELDETPEPETPADEPVTVRPGKPREEGYAIPPEPADPYAGGGQGQGAEEQGGDVQEPPAEQTWEDIPDLYESEDFDAIASILKQNPRAMDYAQTSRMLMILGIPESKRKKILGKEYEKEFKKKYPQGTWPYQSGYDIEMLRDTINSVGVSSKQKSQQTTAVNRAIKEAQAAVKAGTATETQSKIDRLEHQRKRLLQEAKDLNTQANSMQSQWESQRERGETRGTVDTLSAFGRGPKGTRQRATAKRKEAQKLKEQIAKMVPLQKTPLITFGGARYYLDGAVLRKGGKMVPNCVPKS